MRVLVTGGAGFVGSNVAVGLAQRHPEWDVTAFDNLKRRGSELNLARLRSSGVRFEHGDVRASEDLVACEPAEVVIECSAEPSVLAGLEGGLDYLVRTNLVGAYNCLEFARRTQAQFVFLSTSRVYPVADLAALEIVETDSRFELSPAQRVDGASSRGIDEDFSLRGARTFYGSTKLAAELLIEEYAASFGLRTVVNRCGVIAGPWQMGKVDQGIFSYWLLAHYFRTPLEYIGFGGTGKQVRDLLHVDDLLDLLEEQLAQPEHWSGVTVNVGGGRECSLSLTEATSLCRELTGNVVEIGSASASRPGDVPVYLSDCTKLFALGSFRPTRGAERVLQDTLDWIGANEGPIRSSLGFE